MIPVPWDPKNPQGNATVLFSHPCSKVLQTFEYVFLILRMQRQALTYTKTEEKSGQWFVMMRFVGGADQCSSTL